MFNVVWWRLNKLWKKSFGICNERKLPLAQEISELQMVGDWESSEGVAF